MLESAKPKSAMPTHLRYDLHSHSTKSDGMLTPAELVLRAAGRGVDVLALTDHDELAGLPEARDTAGSAGIVLIDGIELSVSWQDITVHIVGLGIDPRCAVLIDGMETIRAGRHQRGRLMGESLARAGIHGAFDGALKFAANEQLLSRTHFARHLVESGHAKDVRDVFRKFLTPGRPGYVHHDWASLGDAIDWIRAAGGQSVLAHPGRYKVNATRLRALLAEFRDSGGEAIEVVTSSHTEGQFTEFAGYALRFGFLASAGSDYHGPGESWMDLGDLPVLPHGLTPVWHDWADRHAVWASR